MAAEPDVVCTYCRTVNVAARQRCRTCERPLMDAGVAASPRPSLSCLRCDQPLRFFGERTLEEIPVEIHVCFGCGHVELLAPGVVQNRALPIPASSAQADVASLPLPHEGRDAS